MCLASLLLCASLADGAFPPPCDPTPVQKPVQVVRREIVVSIIGGERPSAPPAQRTVANCFAHWKKLMDAEIYNKPDLVVLPEGVDSWHGMKDVDKRDWVKVRGDRLLKLFQAYAREHACYLVFNSYRQRKDGGQSNTSFMLDREGDVIGVYDKVYPTPGEIKWKNFPITPGKAPVAVDADFGRVAFATCYDLNFRDLIEANRKLKPDIICFCSAYNGDFWQRVWSYTCHSYLIAATVGPRLAKDVAGPAGEVIYHLHDYFTTCTVKINTNFRVCHLDDNWQNLKAAEMKYGRRIEVRKSGAVGAVTILSNDPQLPIDDVVKEFGLILREDYYDRSVRLRGGPLN